MPIQLTTSVFWGGIEYIAGQSIPGLDPAEEAGLVSSNRAFYTSGPFVNNAGVAVESFRNPLTGGIEISAGGEPVSVGGTAYRESASPHIIGNAAILDTLFRSSIDRYHLHVFGDSRLSGIVTSRFVARAPEWVTIGGVEVEQSNLETKAGLEISAYLTGGGDNIPTSPYIGYSADGGVCSREIRTTAGTTPSNNATGSRLAMGNVFSGGGFADVRARFAQHGVNVGAVVRASPEGWSGEGDPTLSLFARPDNISSVVTWRTSTPLSLHAAGGPSYQASFISIPPGLNWDAPEHLSFDFGITFERGKLVTNTGKTTSISKCWLETRGLGGVIWHPTSTVAGSSILRIIDNRMSPVDMFARAIPAYGGRPAFLIGLGTNSNLPTEDQYIAALQQCVNKMRLASPDAPIVLLTSFATQAEGDVEPHYVLAMRKFAQSDRNAVVIDSYAALPKYTEGNSLGYYSDTVHYNTTGHDAYADMFWSLVAAS